MAELPAPQQQRIVLPPHRQRAGRPRSVRIREWVRRNLFPSRTGTALTLAAAVVIGVLIAGAVWFVFFEANWQVVSVNRKLLFSGSFPADQEWRLWASMIFIFVLIGLAYGTWSSLGRRDHLFIVVAGAFIIFLMSHPQGASEAMPNPGAPIWSSVWFLIAVGALYLAYFVTVRLPRSDGPGRRVQTRAVGALLALALPIVLIVLMVADGAATNQFDGFVLNLILAPVGIVGGVLVAIPLAMGRASQMRTISWTCTAYIEVVRGAPLLGWLFVALFILDDVIGGDLIVRTMVVLAVFTGAYMAEYLRGALQALPGGQYEAAHSVGLTRIQAMRLIILPQAFRISIPPMVGQAIAIWKDTTLVSIILGLRELKGNADSAIAQSEFIPDRIEAYVFVAVIFWVVAFMMSRVSQRIETSQGIGER